MTDQTDSPGVIAPPPVIALLTVGLGLGLDILLPAPVFAMPHGARIAFGAILMGSGVAIAIIAERHFHRIGTNALPWKPALKLATDGIYAHTRNPMYLGLALFVAGLAIALASMWTLLLLPIMLVVVHYGVVLREERYLERTFGDEYLRFKSSVPRYGWK